MCCPEATVRNSVPMPACSRFLAVFLASAVISADGLAASIVSYRAQVASSMSAAPAAPVAAPEADEAELVRRLEDAMDLAEARERYGEVGAPLMLVKVFSRQCKACRAIGPRLVAVAVTMPVAVVVVAVVIVPVAAVLPRMLKALRGDAAQSEPRQRKQRTSAQARGC